MANCDTRLAKIYEILNKVWMNRSPNEFYQTVIDAETIGSAINYLRDSSKIQTMAKAVAGDVSSKMYLTEEIVKLEKLVEEDKNALKQLPKKKSIKINGRSKNGFIGRFEALDKEFRIREIEAENAKIDAERSKIKAKIASNQQKIRKLTAMSKKMQNKNGIINLCFSDEKEYLEGQYQKLVNSCVASLNVGKMGKALMGEDGREAAFVYHKETNSYEPNIKVLRSFLRKIRDEKSIMSAVDYFESKDKLAILENNRAIQEAIHSMAENYFNVQNMPELSTIIDDMNDIAKSYKELHEIEVKSSKGTFLERMRNLACDLVGHNRVSRKVSRSEIKKRKEISEKIYSLSQRIQHNSPLRKAFDAYINIRNKSENLNLSLSNLEAFARNIEYRGTHHTNIISTQIVSANELNNTVMKMNNYATETIEKIKEEERNEKERIATLESKLTKKTVKLIEEEGATRIFEYAEQFYGRKRTLPRQRRRKKRA